ARRRSAGSRRSPATRGGPARRGVRPPRAPPPGCAGPRCSGSRCGRRRRRGNAWSSPGGTSGPRAGAPSTRGTIACAAWPSWLECWSLGTSLGTISCPPIVLISGVSTRVVDAGDRDWVFVRVDTDEPGLFGWGEASLGWHTRAIVGAVGDLEALL